MSGCRIITRKDGYILSALVQDGRVVELHPQADCVETRPVVGDIYIGKVRNVVKNIGAAFVEFAKGQTGYLSLHEYETCTIHTQGRVYQEGRVLIGDEIFVQVSREAVKTKPPTLSGKLDFTGRYMVLSVGKTGNSVSKKIMDQELRSHLQELMDECKIPQGGWTARTNCAGTSDEEIRQEMESLEEKCRRMLEQDIHKGPFYAVSKAPEGFLADLRDGYDSQTDQILTDEEDLHQRIHAYMEEYMPAQLHKLALWPEGHGKLSVVYNVDRTLEHALMPKVWLKSGAYLVIQPTEALVSIDVNSGKAVSKKRDIQETYTRINQEAACEIAYQLRLRNLSGMILVDFIDMKDKQAGGELLQTLRREVKKDHVPTTVVDMTRLGLVEMTRKKTTASLWEQIQRVRKEQQHEQEKGTQS